jgi:polyphosphate glucokinase
MKPKDTSQRKNAGRESVHSHNSGQANHNNNLKILVIDVGGTNVKVLASGMKEPIKIPSGPTMNPALMVRKVKEAVKGVDYDVVSIGYPAPVVQGRPLREPHNLAPGWVGFNFRRAFERPVKIINDAAMQALGSYKEGRMLFLGLGTGLGSAMISERVLEPMELAHLPYKKGKTYEDYIGLRGLEKLGRKKWSKEVAKVVAKLREALQADHVVLGGGNAKKLEKLPPDCSLGNNRNAFIGGFRMWHEEKASGKKTTNHLAGARHG